MYDPAPDIGWVSVGSDHDTAAFEVNTIRTWRARVGTDAYPPANRLLICAGGGGSSGYRTRLRKTEPAELDALRAHRPA